MRTLGKILIIVSLVITTSCNKNKEPQRYCWQLVDNSGASLNQVCNKTEAELRQCVNDGTCGIYPFITPVSECNYYQITGDKFCWQIGNGYLTDATESFANLISKCYGGGVTPVKVDCSIATCQKWYHRLEKTYKPANTITYSVTTIQNFCGDTLATLYQGRRITLKDDADSLIVLQFSNNGTNW